MSSSCTSSTALPATCVSRSRPSSAWSAAGVGFVSISEQMDFTTPIGKVILPTLAAFAQYYSDNLSTETKKGKAERKAQGLYNGLLPFGLKTNPDGIPVPDPETYPGCSSPSASRPRARATARSPTALNAAGYRTTGNRGSQSLHQRHGLRAAAEPVLPGELPDGKGGWMPGAHQPVLDAELFEQAQQARAANRRAPGPKSVPPGKRTHSLSGLGICAHCGSRLHVMTDRHGKARIYCYASPPGTALWAALGPPRRHRSPDRGAPRDVPPAR